MAETPENERIRGAIERFEEPLLRFASTIVGVHQARDVVQDVFLELVKEPFSGLEDHLAAWMFTVCRNKALTEKRKQRRLVGEEEASVEASMNGGPEGTLETKQSASQLLLAMDALSERDREVVALKFAGGPQLQRNCNCYAAHRHPRGGHSPRSPQEDPRARGQARATPRREEGVMTKSMDKLDKNDPRLTAYVLGELEESERRALELSLSSSPDLEDEVLEIAKMARSLEPLALGRRPGKALGRAAERRRRSPRPT